MFRAIRAKKALFGYSIDLHNVDSIIAAGKGLEKAQQLGMNIQIGNRMGSCDIKIYTDCETMATSFALAHADGAVIKPKETKPDVNTI